MDETIDDEFLSRNASEPMTGFGATYAFRLRPLSAVSVSFISLVD
jgi:hypothetical protein